MDKNKRRRINQLSQEVITKYFTPLPYTNEEEFLAAMSSIYLGIAKQLADKGYTIPYLEGYKKIAIKSINDNDESNIKIFENTSKYTSEVEIAGHLEVINKIGKNDVRPHKTIAQYFKPIIYDGINNLPKSSKNNINNDTNNLDKKPKFQVIIEALLDLKNAKTIILEKAEKWIQVPNECPIDIGIAEIISHVLNGVERHYTKPERTQITANIYYINLYILYLSWYNKLNDDPAFKGLLVNNTNKKRIVFTIFKMIKKNDNIDYSKHLIKGERLYFIIRYYGPASLLDLNGKRSISHIFDLGKKNWEIFEDKTINGPNIEKHEMKLLPNDLQIMFLKVNNSMLDEYWKDNRLKIIKNLISYNKIKDYIKDRKINLEDVGDL